MGNTQDYLLAIDVFKANGWLSSHGGRTSETSIKELAKAQSLLSMCNEEEKFLVVELLKRFAVYRHYIYEDLISSVVSKIDQGLYSNIERIIILPANLPEDRNKSPSAVMYPMESKFSIVQNTVSSDSIGSYPSIDSLRLFSARKNTMIVFTDDYSGTGESAIAALNYYKNNFEIESDRVLVLLLVAHEKAVEKIRSMVKNLYTAELRNRGISDFYTGNDLSKATKYMNDLEAKIGIEAHFRFGYGQTEGLEAMIKTPDNTFPIFWKSNGSAIQDWPAIFPRT